MAAWLWILEELLGNTEVPIGAIKEILRYVVEDDAEVQPCLQKRLVLRHLEEFLGSDQPFEPSMTIPLVEDLGLSNDDRNKIVSWMTDSNPKARKNLVQYIQREKATFDIPILRKIARDVTIGAYPVPIKIDESQARPQQEYAPRDEEDKSREFANVTTGRHHRSVGSEDTTVIVDGDAPAKDNVEDQEETSASPESADAEDAFNMNKALSENVNTRRRPKRKLSPEEQGFEFGPDKKMEECFNCKKKGRLICCEGCPMAMHPICAGFKKVPEENWHCPLCVIKIASETVLKAQKQALLAKEQYEKMYVKREVPDDGDYVPSPKSHRHGRERPSSSPDRETGRIAMPGVRRQKLPWSSLEEETLKELFAKFLRDGRVKWSSILEKGRGKFDPTRTAGDLKDKWRNIVKSCAE